MKIIFIFVITMLAMIGCTDNSGLIREENAGFSAESTADPSFSPSTSTKTTKIDSAELTQKIGSTEIRDGDCFRWLNDQERAIWESQNNIEFTDVILVLCEGEWEGKVLSSFEIGRSGSFPGMDYITEKADRGCNDRRNTMFLHPTESSWILGDREIVCVQEWKAKQLNLIHSYRLKADECFDDLQDPTFLGMVALKPCSGSWEYRVNRVLPLDNGVFPGDSYLADRANSMCGTGDWYWMPMVETWEYGDRSIICFQER